MRLPSTSDESWPTQTPGAEAYHALTDGATVGDADGEVLGDADGEVLIAATGAALGVTDGDTVGGSSPMTYITIPGSF